MITGKIVVVAVVDRGLFLVPKQSLRNGILTGGRRS